MKKYIKMLHMGMQNHLEYRGNCFLTLMVSFIPFAVNILIWLVAIKTSKNARFNQDDIITYYFLILIVSNLTECNIEYSISEDIRLGKLNKFLLQPYDYMIYHLMLDLPKRVVFFTVGIVPVGLIYLVLHDFIIFQVDIKMFLLFIIALIIAYLLNFILNFLISEFCFYFTSVTSLFTSFDVVKDIAAGAIFPLNAFPDEVLKIFTILPFQYLGYFPVTILVGHESTNIIFHNITISIIWLIILYLCSRIIWKKGLQKYAAFSG